MREPIFGEGAIPFFIQLLGLGASLALIMGVLLLAHGAYSSVGRALWGEPQHIEGVTPNGVHWKVID